VNGPKSIAFRALRIVVITAAAFAVIVYVHHRLQARAPQDKPSPRVVELGEGGTLDALLARSPVVLVSFGADGCGQCKALKSNLHRMAEAHPRALTVVLVDVDAHPALVREAEVQGVPDTRLYAGGKPVDRRKGYQTQEALHEWLRPHMAAAAYSHTHDHHGHDHHEHEGHDHE
jgi:thioredoxin 1